MIVSHSGENRSREDRRCRPTKQKQEGGSKTEKPISVFTSAFSLSRYRFTLSR
jgi:hypothetical protein